LIDAMIGTDLRPVDREPPKFVTGGGKDRDES